MLILIGKHILMPGFSLRILPFAAENTSDLKILNESVYSVHAPYTENSSLFNAIFCTWKFS